MVTSVADAMNSVRDWDSFQQLMQRLRYYSRNHIWYKR